MFINSDWEREFHILAFDKLENFSGHTDLYLASIIKKITDKYNITYKINSFIVDSANNNIQFGVKYREEIDRSIENSFYEAVIKRGLCFSGEHSLTRCSSHVIHNTSLSFNKSFRIVNDTEAKIVKKRKKSNILEQPHNDQAGAEDFLLNDVGELTAEASNFINQYSNNYNLIPQTNGFTEGGYNHDAAFLSNLYSFVCLKDGIALKNELEEDIMNLQSELSLSENEDVAPTQQSIGSLLRRLRNLIKYSRHYFDAWKNAINETNTIEMDVCEAEKAKEKEVMDKFEEGLENMDKYCKMQETLNKEKKVSRLNLDVETRWSSLYLMLESSSKFKDALIYLLIHNVRQSNHTHHKDLNHLKCAYVSRNEFAVISSLTKMLEPFFTLAEISSKNTTSISCWRELIRELTSVLNDYYDGTSTLLSGLSESDILNIQKCAEIGLKTLKKYHEHDGNSPQLIHAEFLNPIQLATRYILTNEGLNDLRTGSRLYEIHEVKNMILEETLKELWKELNKVLFSNEHLLLNENRKLDDYDRSFENFTSFNREKNILIKKIKSELGFTGTEEPTTVKGRWFAAALQASQSQTLKSSNITTSNDKFLSCGTVPEHLTLENMDICTTEWYLRKKIMNEIEVYIRNCVTPSFVNDNIDAIENLGEKPWAKFDVLLFWKKHEQKCDWLQDNHTYEFNDLVFLPLLAKRCLAGTPASTFCERTFSVATNAYTNRRHNISSEYMESIIPLTINLQGKTGDYTCIEDSYLEISLNDFRNQFGEKHILADTNELENYLLSDANVSLERIINHYDKKS